MRCPPDSEASRVCGSAEQVGDGPGRVFLRLLPHDRDRAGYPHPAGSRAQIPRDQTQKRGLSRAVAPDDAGAFGPETQGQSGEKRGAVRCGP